MKKLLLFVWFFIFAVGSLRAAYQVKNEAELNSAISAGQTDILLTGSFTTTGDITIPAGCTVTLGDGVVLTLDYKKSNKGQVETCHILKGSGTIVEGISAVTTVETRTLPTAGGSNNHFSGMTYEVTKVVKTGGSISKTDASQIECTVTSGISVDGGKTVNTVNIAAQAVVCNVSSGLNGGRTFVAAYDSFGAAYNAAKFTSSPNVTNGKVVVLLADGTASPSGDQKTIGLVVDCAGHSGEIGVELKSNSFITFLNASTASSKQLTNSGVAYLNCSTAKTSSVNTNQDTYSGQVHVYDCGSVSFPSKFPSGGGAFFYCGGPYSISLGTNYKIYGGSFKNDPSSHLASTDLEAVKGSDGNWAVQAKKPVVNVAKVGEKFYETLQAAFDNAGAGAKIELMSDIELTSPVTVTAGKNITLELAGYDVAAASGAIVNNGVLKLEYSLNYEEPSTMTTAAGNLIVNNGTLEVTWGAYNGDILLNSGSFTVHGGTFNGALKTGVNVAVPSSVANLRGGAFKNSVQGFLAGDYIETLHSEDGYYWVGKFPCPVIAEKTVSTAEKGWSITGLSVEDRAIYANSSVERSDYSDSDWYRRAELISMLTPYAGYTIDCAVKFNRSVKAESLRVYAQTQASISQKLDRDMAANEVYRALSSKVAESGYTQISFARFLKGDEFPSLAIGIENLAAENGGTVCTVEFQLCRSKNNVVTETLYVLASESYQFPWKDAVPELREDDTAETVASALVGTADAKIVENIKDAASYISYQKWTACVKGATAAEVKAAPNAWLSYALNTTNIVATPAAGDLKVESIAPAQDGKFTLELSVKDIDIGAGNVDDATMQENLAKVFGIEGATALEASAFSAENVVYTFGTPVDGKVKVEARSAIDGNGSFFMRAKMNP